MDDLCLFADDKGTLRSWRMEVARELGRLRLVPKPGKSRIYRCDEGVEFLGFRVFPTHRRINVPAPPRAHRRLRRLYRGLDRRQVEAHEVRQRLASWLGHARWGDTRGVVREMLASAGRAGSGSASEGRMACPGAQAGGPNQGEGRSGQYV